VFSVTMETHQCIPLALLSNHKMYCAAANSTSVLSEGFV